MRISHFMFFANDLLLAVCFFLDYGNDVRQKANSSNFLIRIQSGWQSSRATSIMHVAQELLMDIQHVAVQEVLQSREDP